jgi:AAA+ ATPase superfamily predicted ATPase
MPVGDPPQIDMKQFIGRQRGERFATFVIHGRPLTGKTAFARQLAAAIPGGVYLDVLAYVAERPELSRRVDLLDAAELKRLAVAYARETGAALLLVDEFDFLVHIWGDDLTEFQLLVEKLSSTETQAIIGFVLQTLPQLEEWQLQNKNTRQSRIFKLEEIKAI